MYAVCCGYTCVGSNGHTDGENPDIYGSIVAAMSFAFTLPFITLTIKFSRQPSEQTTILDHKVLIGMAIGGLIEQLLQALVIVYLHMQVPIVMTLMP